MELVDMGDRKPTEKGIYLCVMFDGESMLHYLRVDHERMLGVTFIDGSSEEFSVDFAKLDGVKVRSVHHSLRIEPGAANDIHIRAREY